MIVCCTKRKENRNDKPPSFGSYNLGSDDFDVANPMTKSGGRIRNLNKMIAHLQTLLSELEEQNEDWNENQNKWTKLKMQIDTL